MTKHRFRSVNLVTLPYYWNGFYATCVLIYVKQGQENLLGMVRRMRWHCPPDTTHWAHDVVATLNHWRWFNVATTSCAQWEDSSPGCLRPSTLHLGHGGSPQYWIITRERVRNILFLWNLNARAVDEPASSVFPCNAPGPPPLTNWKLDTWTTIFAIHYMTFVEFI